MARYGYRLAAWVCRHSAGAGATPGSLMSYGVTKMLSRNPEEYGKGAIDGVAAPEAANNSASTGAMLPMMTLGIPGSYGCCLPVW